MTFQNFNLPPQVLSALEKMDFNTPTPVQEKAIPFALEGRDVMASAQTGTGKTGAFSIPLVVHILNNTKNHALVLTPTRELAAQVVKVIHSLIKDTPIKTALLIGGESMPNQMSQLKKRPQIIVGTPGRINDHLTRGSLMLHNANFIVLDETDRMLDMGFGIQLEAIYKFLPKTRQTLMFSATLPQNIVKLAQKYLVNPESISMDAITKPAENIKHEMIKISDGDKFDRLLDELNNREGSIIIFSKTKFGADKMATKLDKLGHMAEAIHGDLRQSKRDRVIQAFRKEKFRILVATDVAARGLDIPHIAHVINYDLPQCAEDYIHRIGRTARAGATGEAICFVSPQEERLWRAIHKIMYPGEKLEDDRGAGKREGRRPQTKRPFGTKKPFQRRGDKSFSENGRSERNRGEKSFGEKSFSESNRGERSRGERNFSDRGNSEKSFGERGRGERSRSERSFGEKSFSEGNRGERSRSERNFSDRGNSEKSFGENGRGSKFSKESVSFKKAAPRARPANKDITERGATKRPSFNRKARV